MKKWICLLLAAAMCLSLAACGSKTENIVVDGQEVSAKDFLIEYLGAYIQSDDYLAREEEFEKTFGQEAQPFTVTQAFELQAENMGQEGITLHFFMVKAACDYCVDDSGYDNLALVVDYDTGEVYDCFNVDESWMEKSEKEADIYIAAAGGCFLSSDYNGEAIFVDSETHTALSESDIAEINAALSK